MVETQPGSLRCVRCDDHWRYAQGSANAGQGAPVINIAGSVFGGVAGVGSTTTNLAWGRGRGQNRGGRGAGGCIGPAAGDHCSPPAGECRAVVPATQEGSAEQANEEPTDALSITDGLDAEFEINLDLDSDGEEMK
ncbi:hypothetical protein CBS147332_3084 [Penicillium roqueforti]|nr:hypothetical protein CBS147332_3084 [Penicillium roqueforti]KAI3125498.1 hypothetical protein CBS147331_492 [Penicillium roqueforti]